MIHALVKTYIMLYYLQENNLKEHPPTPPAPHPFPIITQYYKKYYTLFRHNNYFINSKPEFGDKTLNQ